MIEQKEFTIGDTKYTVIIGVGSGRFVAKVKNEKGMVEDTLGHKSQAGLNEKIDRFFNGAEQSKTIKALEGEVDRLKKDNANLNDALSRMNVDNASNGDAEEVAKLKEQVTELTEQVKTLKKEKTELSKSLVEAKKAAK